MVVRVGDRVLVEGTSKWWPGGNYLAVVADVGLDGSVKVRYADGGFKRFSRADFERLSTPAQAHHEALEEADSAASGDDVIALEEEEPRLKRRASVNAAAATEARRQRESLRLEREALDDAIRRRDFLRAHSIDSRVRRLEAEAADASSSISDVVRESLRRALGGGVAGAAAMGVQVVTLMWLRTTLTFQYRNGGSTRAALAALYKQGGILRFYQGLAPALLQGPLSRFGDTAANAGVLALLDGDDRTRSLPTGVKSLASATVATAWRVGLMPLDTFKTILQVEGAKGAATLRAKLKAGGPGVLYHGSLGLCASAFLGHYVWYGVYNQADKSLPTHADLAPTLARNAALGFGASAVSDTVTNSVRVVKVFRQSAPTPVSYAEAAAAVVKADGVRGLFGRGLATRLVANGIQASCFSVVWKYLQKRMEAGERR